MQYLILFFIIQFLSTTSNGQKELNLGEVRYDSSFNCTDTQYRRFRDSLPFGVSPICDSHNDLEIRLKTFFTPSGKLELMILSNKEGKWDAKKYTYDRGPLGQSLTTVSYILPESNNLNVEQVCTYLIDTLIKSQLFLLPDQSELKHDLTTLHGEYYFISYKTGNLFRRYSYLNPALNLQHYPDCKEYARMNEIVKTLLQFFRQ